MAPLLLVEDLHADYGSGSVLAGVSLAIEAGEVVSLLGRNGMGKTTTVRAIIGLLCPSRGRIVFRGIAQQGRPCHEVARAGSPRPRSARRAPSLGPCAASLRCFLSWPSAGAIWARICPAASSRWWRSAAR
jgi:branched-chain amino acid transport system ATP-binding protein